MQWDNSINGGFTTGTPWINLCKNYKKINAESQINDEESIFSFYKKLIKLRKESEVVQFGTYELLEEENSELYTYKRKYKNEEILVICNFYENEVINKLDLTGYDLILGNYKENSKNIRPYETRVYKKASV